MKSECEIKLPDDKMLQIKNIPKFKIQINKKLNTKV